MTDAKKIEPFIRTNRQALVRRNGVLKLVAIHTRGDAEYIPWSAGFVRICGRAGDTWTTSVSGVTVVEKE